MVLEGQGRAGLALLIVLAILNVPLLGLSPEAQLFSKENSITVNITAVAVSQTSMKGVLIPLTLKITSGGTGSVNVRSGGPVGETTLESIREATIVGTLLAGTDWRLYDYEVIFHNASGVEGPSASAAVATAVFLTLTGSPALRTFESSAVMTGAISPLGLFSTVGGVLEKCKAARGAGMAFFYPLANYDPKLDECGNSTALPGLLSAAERLTGLTTRAEPVRITMPEEFNRSMINASIWMAGKAMNVLAKYSASMLGPDLVSIYKEAWNAINESTEILEAHPYASASRAFYALYNAFYLDYLYNMLETNGVRGLIDAIRMEANRLLDNLTSLERELTQMPGSGSVYYIEFLGTAYARIASAEASLQDIDIVAQASPTEAISNLAYAKARIYSIRSWIAVAEAVRNLPPIINSSIVAVVNSAVGDYAHVAVTYSISLAKYMLENYRLGQQRALLERSINVLLTTVSKGDNYTVQANYVAALGFYRQALQDSMNRIFSIILGNTSYAQAIYSGYLNETIKLYNYVTAQIAWQGLPPGLAPAYMDYALYLASKNDTATALDMARSALASAMVWYVFKVTSQQTMALGGLGALGPQNPQPLSGVAAYTITAAILGFVLGFALTAWLVSRSIKRVLGPTPP